MKVNIPHMEHLGINKTTKLDTKTEAAAGGPRPSHWEELGATGQCWDDEKEEMAIPSQNPMEDSLWFIG